MDRRDLAEPPKDKVAQLKDQVDGVKNIMTENVDRILARGERLDDLMDKTEDLQMGVTLSYICIKLGESVNVINPDMET
uniref:Vesicle-associated membrane protein 7 n=1 Tax=Oryzias sinensis TaxID=183150 RepID=A0A8C7Z1R4_9TELE